MAVSIICALNINARLLAHLARKVIFEENNCISGEYKAIPVIRGGRWCHLFPPKRGSVLLRQFLIRIKQTSPLFRGECMWRLETSAELRSHLELIDFQTGIPWRKIFSVIISTDPAPDRIKYFHNLSGGGAPVRKYSRKGKPRF